MHTKLLALFITLISFTVYAQENEGINWDESTINDKIKLSIPLSEFQDRYKSADSTATVYRYSCTDTQEKETKFYYYKGVAFELVNDTLHFRSIDFTARKAMYFATDDDWFDHTTKLKSFGRSFPEQSQYVEDLYDEVTDEEYQRVVIFPRNLSADYEWNFNFKDGKLSSIEYVENCM
ncbi:hypothetical protein GN157_09905 [Flavobacterium rakeshii]|uniref:Beta-lactamase-inhibitor-like PepSY-like domain-containing protein n=1 Tax=Flavobacterium rakeshii TaxID=1038845 RepID=A0A6N8HCQ4_9FLAO|nr:hypothetical protein [Flavobacterium rakeshii]MUV04022.1 hypothetical protein [Flavobacterium rakeshii]